MPVCHQFLAFTRTPVPTDMPCAKRANIQRTAHSVSFNGPLRLFSAGLFTASSCSGCRHSKVVHTSERPKHRPLSFAGFIQALFSTSHASIHSLYTSTASLSLWIFAEKRSLQVLHTTLPTCAASAVQQRKRSKLSNSAYDRQRPPLRHSPALPSRFCWNCRTGS